MALLLAPGTRVLDANGDAVSGGKVRVYNANTTTLATLYSDAALSVPLSNPVTCNSTGYPSSDGSTPTLVFCASANYDVAFLNAANTVLRSWEDVPGVGGDSSGDISKTVTGNGRFSVTGSSGSVFIRAGDPTPDDVGGTMVIEGQAGTQLDNLTLDAATTTMSGNESVSGSSTIGGTLLVRGDNSVDEVYASGSLSGSSVVIALYAGQRGHSIELTEIIPSALAALTATVSTDGVTYLSSGYLNNYLNTLTLTATAGNTTKLDLSIGNIPTTAGKNNVIKLDIDTPASGTMDTRVRSEAWCGIPTSQGVYWTHSTIAAGAPITHIKFEMSSGTFSSGRYRYRTRKD